MSIDEIHDAFEKLYLCNNPHASRRNEHGDYVLPSIQDAWAGWLAAYNLLINKIPVNNI